MFTEKTAVFDYKLSMTQMGQDIGDVNPPIYETGCGCSSKNIHRNLQV